MNGDTILIFADERDRTAVTLAKGKVDFALTVSSDKDKAHIFPLKREDVANLAAWLIKELM